MAQSRQGIEPSGERTGMHACDGKDSRARRESVQRHALARSLRRRARPARTVLALLLAGTFAAVGSAGSAAAAPSATGAAQGPPGAPTTPPFSQCPPIGLDTGC